MTRRAGISNEEGADQGKGTMDPVEKLVGLGSPVKQRSNACLLVGERKAT